MASGDVHTYGPADPATAIAALAAGTPASTDNISACQVGNGQIVIIRVET